MPSTVRSNAPENVGLDLLHASPLESSHSLPESLSRSLSVCRTSPPAVDCFFYGFWLPMEKLPAYQASMSHHPGMAAMAAVGS